MACGSRRRRGPSSCRTTADWTNQPNTPATAATNVVTQAEDDPSYKQLVPYVVLKSRDQVYCYERGAKGTESRLHRLLSIGVGGHICKEDGQEGRVAYEAGFARELAEEVEIGTTYHGRIAGLVHDDSTPVGSVHFGVVHVLELAEPHVRPALGPLLLRGR